MKGFTPESWFEFAKTTFELIDREMTEAENSDAIYELYPQLIVQFKFFQQIKGDGLFFSRPHGIDKQNEIFEMESKLKNKLVNIASKLDPTDEKVIFCLNEMKKAFEIN
jgi:hypothetical protein